MNRLEQRLQRLETAAKPSVGLLCIYVPDGESFEACIRKHGYDPLDPTATFIAIDPLDAKS
jgi:hypothetical protein